MNARIVCAMLLAAAAAKGQGVVAGHVTLPVDEYNRLIEMAGKQPKHLDAPPVPFTIQSAELKLRVEGENVAGTVQLEGEVLQKGQLKAPLVTGMTVLDAKQNGRPLPLVQEGGMHAAVLAGPGDFSITLQAGLPLAIEPGRASFTLAAPAAGAVRMSLTVPGEQTVVNVSPGLITGRASSGGKTTVEATLAPGRAATIWWASRLAVVAPAAPKEVRFLSDIKTLVTVSESDLAMTSLAYVTVVQGEPEQFVFEIPAGYELTGATGATLSGSEVRGRRVVLQVNNASVRGHQFLISLTKAVGGTKSAELALPEFVGSQRETGEVLIEGVGTMELAAAERGGLRRMDVKEGSTQLRALAKHSVYAAFRYQKRAAEAPGLAMEWVRFPDTPVLSAVASQAVVTTLVTSEGRSLTEVKLTVKNREQTFLKVGLPAGAQILSAEVAGEKVKPLTGADGDRVPLLRPGFRPTGEYTVSFVFLHSGSPFAKKGGSELALPKMDMPVGLVAWEVFLPKMYKVAEFGGDVVPARLLPVAEMEDDRAGVDKLEQMGMLTGRFTRNDGTRLGVPFGDEVEIGSLGPGQLGGYVVDASGAQVPGVSVTVIHAGRTQRTRTDGAGRWLIAGVPTGQVTIRLDASGFKSLVRNIDYDASRPGRYSFRLDVGSVSETVEVNSSASANARESQQVEKQARQNAALKDVEASANVSDLQKRVVGVLPIAVNVPREGNSYRFMRPLVVDEETKVTFNYKVGK